MRSDRRIAFGARGAEANGGRSSVQTAGVLRPDSLTLRHRLYGHPHIAAKQAQNVIHALELIEQTKDYPPDAQFKWNTEVFWQVEQFYKIATPEQKQKFEQAVREHRIGLDALYGNLLTGLARGEELLRQMEFATDLGRRCGVKVDSMMISDVPGLIWGIVPSLAQAGVKYISDGPNASRGMVGDRIGYVRVQWENHPFAWVSPSGKDRETPAKG